MTSYSGPTILSSPFFVEGILPFLLVFVLVYAVLQKSKVLGDEKKQINALISLVIGLIVVSFGSYVNIILSFIPFLAVGLVIILVFLLLWGIVFQGEFKFGDSARKWFGVLVFIAVVIASLIFTGAWNYFSELFSGDSELLINIIFLVIVAVAIAVVVGVGKSDEGENKG